MLIEGAKLFWQTGGLGPMQGQAVHFFRGSLPHDF